MATADTPIVPEPVIGYAIAPSEGRVGHPSASSSPSLHWVNKSRSTILRGTRSGVTLDSASGNNHHGPSVQCVGGCSISEAAIGVLIVSDHRKECVRVAEDWVHQILSSISQPALMSQGLNVWTRAYLSCVRMASLSWCRDSIRSYYLRHIQIVGVIVS